MSAAGGTNRIERPGVALLPPAAMRAEPWVVVALLAATGLAWWSTTERMAGMDAGPGTALGSLGWFTGAWATMMAAMMLPSLAPAAAGFAASARRELGGVVFFVTGYLLVWSAAGVVAYGAYELGASLFAGSLAWDGAGRPLAAGVLLLAALYQLTPLKQASLTRCRALAAPLDSPRQSNLRAALAAGLRNGGWCLGSSWALMAALFALGVMSLAWMGLIAVLVAVEKFAHSARGPRLAAAAVLLLLAAGVLAAPHEIPGFVVPAASPASPHAMGSMGAMR